MGTDGSQAEILFQPGGGSRHPATIETVNNRLHYLKMAGQEVFRLAVNRMIEGLEGACTKAGILPSALDFIVPHQANIRIMQAVRKFAKIKEEQLLNTIEEHANTSASTVGICLDMNIRNGTIKKGNKIGLTAFGAGLSWAGAVIEID
jgi:3-oxoacyl-[acyl-carrier-protein] synthase-3